MAFQEQALWPSKPKSMAFRLSCSVGPGVLPGRQRSTARLGSGFRRRADVQACGGMSSRGLLLPALRETGLPAIKIPNILLQAEKGWGSHGELLTCCPNHSPNHRGTWLTLARLCGRGPLSGWKLRAASLWRNRPLSSTHVSAKASLKRTLPAPAWTLVYTTEICAEREPLRPALSMGEDPGMLTPVVVAVMILLYINNEPLIQMGS